MKRILFAAVGTVNSSEGLISAPNMVKNTMATFLNRSDEQTSFEDPRKRQLLQDRIEARVTVSPSGCMLCSLSINSGGYSTVYIEGRMWRTHRAYWILKRGEIPEGKVLDHLCGIRSCCNPDHLEPVEMSENSRRHHLPVYPAREAWVRSISDTTECKRGHAYGPEDTRPNGTRDCRECHRIKRRKRYYADLEGHRAKSALRQRKYRKQAKAPIGTG